MNAVSEISGQLNVSVFKRQPIRHLSTMLQDVIGTDDTEEPRPELAKEYFSATSN